MRAMSPSTLRSAVIPFIAATAISVTAWAEEPPAGPASDGASAPTTAPAPAKASAPAPSEASAPPTPPAPPAPVPPAPSGAEQRPFFGGLGKAYLGGIGLDLGGLESSLRPLLGADAGIAHLGLQVGGGGFMLIGGVVLSGGGYAIVTPSTNGSQGDVALSGGGGGVALGYAVVNSRQWIVYPYFGVGGYGQTLRVTNVSGTDLQLGARDVLGPGESGSYDSGFFTADFGISANRLLFFADGGFAVGLDAGFITSAGSTGWERQATGEVADALAWAQLRGAYMRLSLGGGGFFFSD